MACQYIRASTEVQVRESGGGGADRVAILMGAAGYQQAS